MEHKERPSVQKEIKKAFVKLLLQKAYIDITVTDVITKAQVSRMSFYRNFKSMDDVLEGIADEVMKNTTDVISVIRENNERKWRDLLFEMLYNIMRVQKDFEVTFEEVAKNNINNNIIISRVREKMVQTESKFNYKTVADKYATVGKINLLFGIIGKWAFSGMSESPEEIVNIILSLISKF